MNEAERFLEQKINRAKTPKREQVQGADSADNEQSASSTPAGAGPWTPERKPGSGAKVWKVGMAVFGILMTMFWMVFFKGGCR
jgi:hypothetical protein